MTTHTLPRENDKRVQDILKDAELTLIEQATQIYYYDDSCLSREYDRKKPQPSMTIAQIHNILVERLR